MQIVLFHNGSKALDGVLISDQDPTAAKVTVLRLLAAEDPARDHDVTIVSVQPLHLFPGDQSFFRLLDALSASPKIRSTAFCRTLGRLLAQTFNQGREFEHGTGQPH